MPGDEIVKALDGKYKQQRDNKGTLPSYDSPRLLPWRAILIWKDYRKEKA